MTPSGPSLHFCLLFLCGLKGALLSRLGRCAGNLCAFQAIVDFDGAAKECSNTTGKLLMLGSEEHVLNRFQSLSKGFGGGYWLRRPDRKSEEAAERVQTCPAAFLTPGLNVSIVWKPCRSKLSGFLCEFEDVCSRLQTPEGAQVTYATYNGFEMTDSETFPASTAAVERGASGEPPASKHLCFSANWLPAPWNCEVLKGGCDLGCSNKTNKCTCPEGSVLHPNNISCSWDSCAHCAQECRQVGGGHACECREGFRLAQDGKSCLDVSKKEKKDRCGAEGKDCENTQGEAECGEKEDFVWEHGQCVNNSICFFCEHNCTMISGVYQCICGKGYKVSAKDPTKCDMHCTEKECLARCEKNPEKEKKKMEQCYCPDGYIIDKEVKPPMCHEINDCEQKMCEHKCEKLFGSYKCSCNESYELQDGYRCVRLDEEGSGSTESSLKPSSKPARGPSSSYPHVLPSYIKTGSILGITLFLVFCLGLMCFLIRHAVKRCGKFTLSSLKHPDIDIFYLQQVTTETYKRLSIDKQFKNDPQRL